jgi:hypothetical protein
VSIDYKYQEVQHYESFTDIPLHMIKFYRATSLYEQQRDIEALTDFKASLYFGYRVVDCQFYIGSILYSQGDKIKGCEFVHKAMVTGDKEATEFYSKNCK